MEGTVFSHAPLATVTPRHLALSLREPRITPKLCRMSLFDKYLPRHQFAERHHIWIDAPPGAVIDLAARGDLPTDPIISGLMKARSVPGHVLRRLGLNNTVQPPTPAGIPSFISLERVGDREVAMGLVGRFWRPDGGQVRIRDADGFLAFDEPRTAKLVIVWTAQPEGAGTRLVTETRIWCPDTYSRTLLTPYWMVIRLPSGLIRRRMLRAMKQILESERPVLAAP